MGLPTAAVDSSLRPRCCAAGVPANLVPFPAILARWIQIPSIGKVGRSCSPTLLGRFLPVKHSAGGGVAGRIPAGSEQLVSMQFSGEAREVLDLVTDYELLEKTLPN